MSSVIQMHLPDVESMIRLNPKRIYFRRLDGTTWESAQDEKELEAKLDGDMAEIHMPAKPWYVRLWRKVGPLRFVEAQTTREA
jgi:hypothetical protein